MILRISLFSLTTLAMLQEARACIWDSDTIISENARFPGVEEILSGKFPRHSREFYEWRKKRCEEVLLADPLRMPVYDDLAVSQHKLGDHVAAIATMKKKESIRPGLYETFSNLGTFYIYTGELEEALVWINKALAINANAHFGREKYQKWLVEWVMAGKPQEGRRDLERSTLGFDAFVRSKEPPVGGYMEAARWGKCLEGLLGMMRFADFDNPILQEATGDVLAGAEKDAMLLASRAYRLASEKSSDEAEKARLLNKADRITGRHRDLDPEELIKQLHQNLEEGRALNAKVREDEIAWIAAGKDAAAEFEAKYLKP